MRDESVLGYCLNEMKFIRAKYLTYQGVYPCYIIKKGVLKSASMSSYVGSSEYYFKLASKIGNFVGIIYVKPHEFEGAKEREIINYSIITNHKNIVRFSKKADCSSAIKEITSNARKIIVQAILVFLFLVIPTIIYWFYVFTLFF